MDRGCTDDQTTTSDLSISTGSTPIANGTAVTFDPGMEARSRKLMSSRYKGVVPQPNGRWGAQIYEKHQRVWLGTFNEEDEAAKMYDVAVQRFRGGDAVTNFKKLITELEASFLNSHSKSEIVDMLRKHTYNDELEQSKRMVCKSVCQTGFNSSTEPGSHKPREHLFEKTLTPSDVSKLNRLVIPKQYAEKHFPVQIKGSNSKGILLHFEDNDSKIWRFRYSFWNSSQSFVLTRGWSRFVKEKNLKAGDSLRFQCSTGPEKQLYIDWKSRKPVELVEPVQMLRLFGVEIPSVSSYGDKKSNIEIDLLGFRNCKKQRVINAL